ncbi:hypothetical protein QDX25_10450 [Auritidibacter ignavus]|uniref:hypothetical protein n=1 Tax=Auritidibacter TaxID=1160973 RepID=UPI000D73102E|nr:MULTISPECIES: hypothetical protein [Auritidibacter]AXR74658.1 hypothetical protein DCC27_010460 [Auritidibacter sp. NML130574]WGH81196.1 hypothetical protein QDX25_10450 [Auritidibacter ignavus]
MNLKRIPLTVLGVAYAVVVWLSAASADSVEDNGREIVGGEAEAEVSEDFADDIERLAERSETDPEQVHASYAGQEQFLTVLTLAYETHPDLFYSAGWTPDRQEDEGYGAWVAFTEPVEDEVREAFTELPTSVELRYDAEVSEEDMEEARSEALAELYAPAQVDAVSGHFTEDGELEIQVEVDPSDEDEVEPLIEEVERDAPVEVAISTTEDLGIEPEAVLGGVGVTHCTSAFTAYRDGENALLGAHHCPPDAGVPSGGSEELTFVDGHIGPQGDVRVHTTTDPIDNAIVLDPEGDSTREITSRARTPEGALVCNFGQERGSSDCTTVRSANHSFNAIDPDAMEIVRVSNAVQTEAGLTEGGDSGGPWYSGNAALGIHFGQSEDLSTFSNILDAEDVLGVEVNTGSN